jgi:hypothetical protein
MVLVSRFRDLTANLKLTRREVIETLQLMEPGFAVNAKAGLQPLLMGYNVQEAPISCALDMGKSCRQLLAASISPLAQLRLPRKLLLFHVLLLLLMSPAHEG